jgi:hypothetical protein
MKIESIDFSAPKKLRPAITSPDLRHPQYGGLGAKHLVDAMNLLIKIARHALPRRVFGTADIGRRRRQDVLPRAPLDVVRYAIERPLQAGILIAAAALISAAPLAPAGPP